MNDIVIKIEPNKEITVIHIKRNKLEKQEMINEAKEIAASLIGAEFVDGINMYIDGEYAAGIYCDDIAIHKYPYHCTFEGNRAHGPLVIINETKGIAPEEVQNIINYWKENVKYE